MHSLPIPAEVRARNKRTVAWLVGTVTVFTVLCLLYLIKYGANFERHGFH